MRSMELQRNYLVNERGMSSEFENWECLGSPDCLFSLREKPPFLGAKRDKLKRCRKAHFGTSVVDIRLPSIDGDFSTLHAS